MDSNLNLKRLRGQFFTITNPFSVDIFFEWFKSIPNHQEIIILEPFAGSNNIVNLMDEIGFDNKWACYDISPSEINNAKKYKVIEQDTLLNFPQGHTVCITNPPYLAKYSASRKGVEYPSIASKYDDLYKYSLEVMLDNVDYVAAIIPESFITSNLFHNRLYAVIELNCKMFEDTECPVCLALFSPSNTIEDENSFRIFQSNMCLGTYGTLLKYKPSDSTLKLKYNVPEGILGIQCIDNSKEDSICFMRGELIPSDNIKPSSRLSTRLDIPNIELCDELLDNLVNECNKILKVYRRETSDVFLTAFKGLRKDGKYRRRLDYKTATNIIAKALNHLGVDV